MIAGDVQQFFETVRPFATPLAVKLYRVQFGPPLGVPTLPCLDHEAMLHEGIAPHAAAYLQDSGGDLHEVVYIPDENRIDVDTTSTLGEHSSESHERFVAALRAAFAGYHVRVVGPSWLRGDERVAHACRAQITLREVLLGPDIDRTKTAIDRLQTISSLMEKESRVASWGARTIMTPFIALAGFVAYEVIGSLGTEFGAWLDPVRYTIVTLVGGFFMYYGLKAVHLTEMANRVWKRSAEYGLILGERRRLEARRRSTDIG